MYTAVKRGLPICRFAPKDKKQAIPNSGISPDIFSKS